MELHLRAERFRDRPLQSGPERRFPDRGGSIGRSEDNYMVLPDSTRLVSGRHAFVLLRGTRYFIVDTSQNGVFINRSTKPLGWCRTAEITHGDTLGIGDFELRAWISGGELGEATTDAPVLELGLGSEREPAAEPPASPEPTPGPARRPPAGAASKPATLPVARPSQRVGSSPAPRRRVKAAAEPARGPAPALESGPATAPAPASKRAASPPAQPAPEPVAEPEQTPIPAEPPLEPVSDLPAVDALVVDDDESLSFLVKFMLERAGYTVRIASDGLEAKQEIATAPPPRLVVLDVMLPHFDGFQLVQEIRANPRWREVPVVMLSAMTGEREIVRALDAGASDYVPKPFKPAELVARLSRFLG